MRLVRSACGPVALILLFLAVIHPLPIAAVETAPPRLLVLIVFDQFRGDYLFRWHDLFTSDGFQRLEREGAWFTNCHYDYGTTMTGPGHASFLTGCGPDRHGIIMNDWYDRTAAATTYCATSSRYQPVYSYPPPKTTDKKGSDKKDEKPPKGGSPELMRAPSFGEVLKTRTAGRGKVVALSLKDRSAILPAGRTADACYWLDTTSGQFITSTYYRSSAHSWVKAFNERRPADRWFDNSWSRLRQDVDYDRWAGPDDVRGEGLGVVKRQGRTFPHPMNAGLKQPAKDYYETLYTSPFGNELLLEMAIRALVAEQLGAHDDPDLLTLSFSSNDPIGHAFGPDSHEVLDTTLRSDQIVGRLLDTLDRTVGRGRYLLALSSDHGVCQLPELSMQQGIDARRVEPKAVREAANEFLNRTLATSSPRAAWIEQEIFPWTYLNYKVIQARGLKPETVATALAGWFRKQPYVQEAYTRGELEVDPAGLSDFGRRMKKCYFPERCGDVAIVTKPYYLFTTYATGTGHGTPQPYDSHVPLMLMGPGIPTGRSDEAVTPLAIAAVFARAIGAQPPASSEAPVPRHLRSDQR